jgi:hypothetical protein
MYFLHIRTNTVLCHHMHCFMSMFRVHVVHRLIINHSRVTSEASRQIAVGTRQSHCTRTFAQTGSPQKFTAMALATR